MVRYDAQSRLIFDDGSAAYDMACHGYGIVWAPEWLARDGLRRGRVVEVLKACRASEMPMPIIRRDRRFTPRRVRLVIGFLREAAKGWQVREAPERGNPT